MAQFVWKDAFAIGIGELDLQHRHFFELLNECYEDVIRHRSASISPELLARLKDYAATHFRDEEALMLSRGDRGLEEQRVQHRYFQLLLADLEGGRLQGPGTTMEGMLAFLSDWLLSHILQVDRKIAGAATP